MNKLDYLAQKEEELRKLNDQLDSKSKVLKDNQADLENKKEEEGEQIVEQKGKELFTNNNWVLNQIADGANDDPEYNQDAFENESPTPSAGKDLKVAHKDSEEPDDALHEVQNY